MRMMDEAGMWRVSVRYSQGRVGVFAPARFAGVHEAALAVAAVIECEDVEACVVQRRESADGVAEVAGFAVEIDGGKARLGCGGNPPAAKLRLAGSGGSEADGFEGKIDVRGSSRDSGGGVVEQLPAALPEEDAQCSPCAKECGEEDHGKCRRAATLPETVGGADVEVAACAPDAGRGRAMRSGNFWTGFGLLIF